MTEPISVGGAAWGGPKALVLIAQFAGVLAGLSEHERMKWWRALIALAVGYSATFYLTPLALHFLTIPAFLEAPIGWVLGLVSVRFIPPFLDWVGRAASDPIAVIFRRETPPAQQPSKD